MRIKILAIAGLVCGLTLQARQAAPGQIPQSGIASQTIPVSLWPKGGIAPSDLAGHYVFYDRAKDEIVVAYPASMDETNLAPSVVNKNAKLKSFRFETNRGTKAAITFSVSPVQGGYRFSYRVANGNGARQPITNLELVVRTSPDHSPTSPRLWRSDVTPSKIAAIDIALGTKGASGAFLSWFFVDEKTAIKPGESVEGFGVVTKQKPGISMMYITGGYFASRPEMPSPVSDQLIPVVSMQFNSQNVIAIAPKFPLGTARSVIAEDFYLGINRMMDSGQLDRKKPSLAIQEVLEKLQDYFRNVEGNANVPLSLSQKPQSPFEDALLKAVFLAMN
ncbi:MAG TPA: hypothetical protein VK210_10965 [Terriglobia bacterium]|nr:hypothetical protein [Terriglobia bacterium]